MSARLHRALSRDPKLGSLVDPSRRRTQSKGGNLELLLTAHFRNSEVTEEMADHAAARRAGCSDWWVAARVVTYRRVEWAIDSFAPYRSREMDGILPALLQEGRRVVVPSQDFSCLPGY